jgi:hypothetical protein
MGAMQNTKHTATAPNKEQTFNAMPNHWQNFSYSL